MLITVLSVGLMVKATAVPEITHVSPQEPNHMIDSRTHQQQLARLINNGVPFTRAATRIASDVPDHIRNFNQDNTVSSQHIQQELARLTANGMQYSRAATRAVASDRIPICMNIPGQDTDGKVGRDLTRNGAKEGLKIWSLNVRSINTEDRIKELEQEAGLCEKGILLIQETWRKQENNGSILAAGYSTAREIKTAPGAMARV